MMNITYIHHSGYLVELDYTLLLFDYVGGPLPPLNPEKKLVVFSSHRHEDHFDPMIFDLADACAQVRFVLSDDIWKKRVPSPLSGQTDFVKPGKTLSLPDGWNVKIRTYRSTDEGVAFFVETENHTVYHAGDLNDWKWEGESDSWNNTMHANYMTELKKMQADGIKPEAAMVPVDGRLEQWFYLGVQEFMELVGAEMVFPMHFWKDFGIIDRLKQLPCAAAYRNRIADIRKDGQTFSYRDTASCSSTAVYPDAAPHSDTSSSHTSFAPHNGADHPAAILIQGGRVIDPKSGTDTCMDIAVCGETITAIGKDLADQYPNAKIIDARGLTVAPGLIDVHVHFRDPGLTYKEDIHTGAAAAARGGFTTVVCMANTKPPVDNIETLEYVLREGEKTGIRVLQAATITVGMKGETLTDMETLKAHGAAGFTDDGIPIMNASLVKAAMEKAAGLNLPLSFHEEDPEFITNNGINHGTVSTELGIEGSPALAEDVMVARDCMIALHTGASVDIQHISSANSVRIVRLAKQLGADVYAEVTPHHFTLDETAVLKHGTLAKMNPPLRTARDREEILRGLREGTIDIIATDHAPHSAEEKSRPLTQAPSGIIGLETSLALGITVLVRDGYLSLSGLIEKMSVNPAKLYRLDSGYLSEGAAADLVIFDPEEAWTVTDFASKASNSPFVGETLYGKVKYTICKGIIVYED